jgi:hypothetical protein
MRNAGEFNGQWSDLTRVLPAHRRTGPGVRSGSGRIRYAHGGAVPRLEPFCGVPQAGPVHRGHEAGNAKDDEYISEDRYISGSRGSGDGGSGGSGGNGGAGRWPGELPVGGRHGDLWVLVCGGIAAAAAFAAAFAAIRRRRRARFPP